MKQFLIKLCIFSAPLVLLFAFPFLTFFVSGEFKSISAVVDYQYAEQQPILYQSAFTSATEKLYKTLMTEKTHPEVLALGKSRVSQIRTDFFKPGVNFYNASRAIHNAPDLVPYIQKISNDGSPKVIIFDVSDLLRYEPADPDDEVEQTTVLGRLHSFFISGWRQTYVYYVQGKFSLRQLVREKRELPSIGLSALVYHQGYRKDGSHQWGDEGGIIEMKKKVSGDIQHVVENIVPTRGGFEYEPSLSTESLQDIESFLALCKEKNIYVVGYMSPFATEIYQKMQSIKDSYGEVFRATGPVFTDLFQTYGYHFYDLRDMGRTGSSDAELYDPVHSTGKGLIRVLVYLASHEQKLTSYIDVRSLKEKLSVEPF